MEKRDRGMIQLLLGLALILFPSAAASSPPTDPAVAEPKQERHLANIRQLTFGGQNAEAYFSHDGTNWL